MIKLSRYLIGVLLITTGLFLLTSSFWTDYLVHSNSEYVKEHMKLKNKSSRQVLFDFSEVAPLSLSDVIKSRGDFHDLPTIGLIFIPDVSLELPILYGLDDSNLAVGAGTMRPDQQMGKGNYALAGHYTQNRTALFGPLHNLEIGTIIYISDGKHTFEYLVTSIETVSPTRVDVLNESVSPTITLVTCTFDASERLIVKGELIGSS